ncbi:MAG: hypothetical protein OEW35_00475 [Gammaproteobacteria bacterium]|nr:hypothetical protein [Gammaproteobacteria bacterium]MDH4254655.1 hypothetical protein [Gammaproteobacteria bacterium]MDH5308338.1 hypothetical protein [Gammaproteobacteria bacterium]
MADQATISAVRGLMHDFAVRTGLSAAGRAPRRYLWTDAHAVCNFLGLYRASGDRRDLDLAVALVDQVHAVLGRHRPGDTRRGWISGLPEEAGREHPTAGGLRIGKPLPERARDEPADERIEWDRDGQYFHYLTKWMHALARMAAVTGSDRYLRWAIELATAALAGFVAPTRTGDAQRLYWKMSVDLSYPLVSSSGLHDPLDGYLTFSELQHARARFPADALGDIGAEVTLLGAMLDGQYWHTDDPLGIGGLLVDAHRALELTGQGALPDRSLVPRLTAAAAESLQFYAAHAGLSLPADNRLAFRELGLAIGLHAVPMIARAAAGQPEPVRHSARLLVRHVALAERIERFWREPRHQQSHTWRDHEDINAVMLATSLLPDEFLAV